MTGLPNPGGIYYSVYRMEHIIDPLLLFEKNSPWRSASNLCMYVLVMYITICIHVWISTCIWTTWHHRITVKYIYIMLCLLMKLVLAELLNCNQWMKVQNTTAIFLGEIFCKWWEMKFSYLSPKIITNLCINVLLL